MPKKKHDSAITPFTQHGFLPEGRSGDQAFGVCPFCAKSGHFYVHRETHNWDCKSCGKKGGYQSYLREIVKHCQKFFKGAPAIELSKDRAVKLPILRQAGVGYNPANKSFILPVMDSNNEKIWDVRIFGKQGLRSTSGCKVGLYNWDKLNPSIETVWLCEGEWDCLVMQGMIEEFELPATIAVAVPGAGTFKAEWITLFERKTVYAVYDHDTAGFEGAKKVHNNLSQVCDLKFVHWPEESTKGWDLRDQYQASKKNSKKVYAMMKVLLQDLPPGLDSKEDLDFGADVKVAKTELTGEGLEAKEVYKRYQKWLKLPTTHVLDVMFGTVIANRLPGDPLWLFLVAPSGATKTELLMSMVTAPKMVTTTTLTPPALISGANVAGGNDPSMLRIMNERILLIKDFTTILSMNTLIREEIFGLLRDAYDGRIEKRFGNGVYRLYDPCRFGIVAGVTPAIELFTDEHTALGERFLRYRVPVSPDWKVQREILKRAIMNTTQEDEMRADLQKIGKEVLDYNFKETPMIPDAIIEKILSLAQWTSVMRSTIVRDRFSKEVTHKPFSELGTRLAKQFCKLLLGIGMFRRMKTVTNAEYLLVKDIAIGTVPSRMEEITRLVYLTNKDGHWDGREIAEAINLPPMTTSRIIENLGMLTIFKKKKISEHRSQWVMSKGVIELIEQAEIY